MDKALRPKNAVIHGLLASGPTIFAICCIIPLFVAVYNSLFEWNGGPERTFIGFQSYVELIHDKASWSVFMNNLAFIFWAMIGQIGIALIIAMPLQSRILKLRNLHRTVIFFPVVLSAVVVGFLWRVMYDSEYGIVNTLMQSLGLGCYTQLWLDNPDIVIGSLAIPKVWQFIGCYLIILLAAIRGIDQNVLKVVELGGTTGWKKSFYIVMPLIKGTLMMTVMLCISGNMKIFDQIFIMTGGESGTSSEVVTFYAYNVFMNQMRHGYGSMAAIGILILSLDLIAISKLAGRKKEEGTWKKQ